MPKMKKKGNPRKRAFLLAAILSGALTPIFLALMILLQLDFERQQDEAWLLTQSYLACVPTQVTATHLPDVTELVEQSLDAADIAYDRVDTYALMDYCLSQPALRPGALSIWLQIPEAQQEDGAALGERITALLHALETIPHEQIEKVERLLLYFGNNHRLFWVMDVEEALYWLGEDVDPVDLYEEGRYVARHN